MRVFAPWVCCALLFFGCKESPSQRAIREAQNRTDAGAVVAPVPEHATLLASGQNVPRNLLVDGTHLYWVNDGLRAEGKPGIFRVSRDGGDPQTLYEGKGVDTIALSGGFVYALFPADEVVVRIPKSGGAPEPVMEEVEGLSAIVADEQAVYWTCEEGIVKVAGDGKPQVLIKGVAHPAGLSADEANLYWYNVISGQLMAVPKKGGRPAPLLKQELTLHGHFAHGGQLFWTLGSDKKAEIRRASHKGGAHAVVAAGLPIPVELTADGSHVYFTTGDAVMRAPREGGEATLVVDKTDRSIGVAVDAQSVYWTDRGGRIQKVPR
jgi:hypothetical protein